FVFLSLVFYLTFQGAFVETLVRFANWLSFIGKKGIVTSAEKAKTLYINVRPNKRLQITDQSTPKKKKEIKLPKISTSFLRSEKKEKIDLPMQDEVTEVQEARVAPLAVSKGFEDEKVNFDEADEVSTEPVENIATKIEVRRQNIQDVNYATNELISKLT